MYRNNTDGAHAGAAPLLVTGLLFAACSLPLMPPAHAAGGQGHGSHRTHTKKSAPLGPRTVVVVLPPDTHGGAAAALSDMVLGVEESRLDTSARYQGIQFTRALPSVQRALNEQTLTESDVTPPWDNDTKVKRVAQVLGYDHALVSSIDDYQYDPAKREVTIVMTARLIDLNPDHPASRSAGESISTPMNSVQSADDVTAVIPITRTLVEKLMTSLLQPASSMPAAAAPTR